MNYQEFVERVQHSMHETIYEDSEGRSILVIDLLDAFALANKFIDDKGAEMQAKIETIHAMYELAVKQRDYLMDQQSAQVAAMRGRVQ
jgi:regulator of RNase E activity RraB